MIRSNRAGDAILPSLRLVAVEWGARELHWLRNVSRPVATYLATAREQQIAWGPGEAARGGRPGALKPKRVRVTGAGRETTA